MVRRNGSAPSGPELVGAVEELFAADQAIQDPHRVRTFRRNQVSRHHQLVHHVERKASQEVLNPRCRVGKAQPGGCDGERRCLVTDHQIAVQHQVAGPTPDSPVDHGDDRTGIPAHRPQELLEGVGERERVDPAHGQLVDVVASGPHVVDVRGSQYDRTDPLGLELAQRVQHLLHRRCTQGVPLGEVVQLDRADLVVDTDPDIGAHGESDTFRGASGPVPDRRDLRLRFLIRLPQAAMSHHAPRPAWERS